MANKILHHSSLHTDFAALFLRIILGGLFIYYGYGKLTNYDGMLKMFGDPIGIGTKLSVILVIFAEFFCGIFVLVGFLTRLSVIPIFITMIVAYFVAHADDPFTAKQISLVYMLLCVVVFVLGSGKYSVDRMLFGSRGRV